MSVPPCLIRGDTKRYYEEVRRSDEKANKLIKEAEESIPKSLKLGLFISHMSIPIF